MHFVTRKCIGSSSGFEKGRYVCQRLLGSGTYGRVVQAEDLKYKMQIAVKVTRRGIQAYTDAAEREITFLRQLDGKHGTPKLLRLSPCPLLSLFSLSSLSLPLQRVVRV